MSCESCAFDVRNIPIAIKRGLRESGDGLRYIGFEALNTVSRIQEILSPENKYFSPKLEVKTNVKTGERRIHWKSYVKSVESSMKRAEATARFFHRSSAEIDGLNAQRRLWNAFEQHALNLSDGESTSYITPKSINAKDGVSFIQIKKIGGELIEECQLLPFKTDTEVQNFKDNLLQKQNISLQGDPKNIMPPLLFWVAEGRPIDFKNELPAIIQTAEQPLLVANNVSSIMAPRDRIAAMPNFMAGGGITSQVDSMMAKIHNETGLSLAKNLSAEPVKNVVQESIAGVGVSMVVPMSVTASVVFAESLPAVAANLVVVKDALLVDQPKINASEVVEAAQVKAPELALVENVPNTAVVFFEEKKPKENTKKDDFAAEAEVKVTWDNRMIKRFEEATRPAIERVVYDVTYKATEIQSEEQRFEESRAEFHEFVQDLDEEEPILLVDTKEELIQKDPEAENVFEALELQETSHHDTARYHSEEESIDELPDQTKEVAPIIQEQTKDAQPNNFFIPNGLLTNYLLWREMFNHNHTPGINIDDQPSEKSQLDIKKEKREEDELDGIDVQKTSFATKAEQHKTQAKKVKVKTRKASSAFLSLLLLTKIKLLTKVKLLARKNRKANFAQLFATDTLLLFLLNPKLFLVNKSTVAD